LVVHEDAAPVALSTSLAVTLLDIMVQLARNGGALALWRSGTGPVLCDLLGCRLPPPLREVLLGLLRDAMLDAGADAVPGLRAVLAVVSGATPAPPRVRIDVLATLGAALAEASASSHAAFRYVCRAVDAKKPGSETDLVSVLPVCCALLCRRRAAKRRMWRSRRYRRSHWPSPLRTTPNER
jgi:hypothetical protein